MRSAFGRRMIVISSGSRRSTLKQRARWIRLIIEFAGTFLLITVAARPAVINLTPRACPSPGSPR